MASCIATPVHRHGHTNTNMGTHMHIAEASNTVDFRIFEKSEFAKNLPIDILNE